MDDEYVIMESIIKHSIDAYNRLFLKDNVYVWDNENNKDFLKFQVVELDGFTGKIRVSVKILDYRNNGISKQLLDKTGLLLFDCIMRKPLNFDLSICSINDFDIYIINSSQFILPEKPKKFQPEFKIYTGRKGFETLRNSSYLFSDDTSDLLMSYEMALGVNRNR